MISNYIKLALRNFQKNKFFAFINVLGLAIGISTSLVIYLIVQYEFSYDAHHVDKERIFRVVSKINSLDMTFGNSGVPIPLTEAVRLGATGVELSTHFLTLNKAKVSVTKSVGTPSVFKGQDNIVAADNQYFSMFRYQWLAGSPETALVDPFTVVLAESRAKAYFSYQDPEELLGIQLTYDDSITVSVNGIVKDMDTATDFTFVEFLSLGTIEHTGLKERWGWMEWGNLTSSSQFFVKLSKGSTPASIEEQLVTLRAKHREQNEREDDMQHFLQPLTGIHFDPNYGSFDNTVSQGSKPVLYGLLAVAGFLLLLGCINFINLSTAQASRRAKEVGIRKTLGSGRDQLTVQFLGETFIFTISATVLALALVPLVLYILEDFVPTGVSVSSIYSLHVLVFLAGLVIVVSVLAGLYPGLVLSRFQPVAILRNQIVADRSTSHRVWLRRILTVTQFVIAQFLVLLTIVVSKQIAYSLNKELGYKKDAIVFFHAPSVRSSRASDTRRFVLLRELRQIPEIVKVSLAGAPPASRGSLSSSLKVNNGKEIKETMVEIKYADANLFDLYGMKLVAGRNLTESDTLREYVINETYAKFLGLTPEEALNHVIELHSHVPIVGVVADFHTKSTQAPIKPLAYSSEMRNSYTFHLALNPDDRNSWEPTLSKVETAFKKLYPDGTFNAEFFDKTVEAFYQKEQRTARLLNWASGLSILISCMGLLGLAIYTTSVRVKEIGVRKVLGASALQVVALLSRDFLALVLTAFVVVAPIGWWASHRWLEDYAYRTPVNWWVFASVGVLALLVALLTISLQAIKAALANPVEALRYE